MLYSFMNSLHNYLLFLYIQKLNIYNDGHDIGTSMIVMVPVISIGKILHELWLLGYKCIVGREFCTNG